MDVKMRELFGLDMLIDNNFVAYTCCFCDLFYRMLL